jgi:hypothetical protein
VEKDYAAAEQSLRASLAARQAQGASSMDDLRNEGAISTWLAMALAPQGKNAEAAKLLTEAKNPIAVAPTTLPAVLSDSKQSAFFRNNLSLAYAKAPALLQEAATLLDSLPANVVCIHACCASTSPAGSRIH